MYYWYYKCITFCLHVYVHTMYVPSDFTDQKRTSDTQELEFWVVVSYIVGAENQTLVLCKSHKCL